MQRTPINPSSWSVKLGFDQAELVEDHQRLLVVSGQDAVDADGTPQHSGDMAAQLETGYPFVEALELRSRGAGKRGQLSRKSSR